ncbi:MAG: uroporphyrinogen decarboxylase family protein [Clostridia bacterium]|jgi:uroporphyrinogen decarboxylase
MNRRETVIQVLQHKETEICPFSANFTKQTQANLINYTKDPNIISKLDSYVHMAEYWGRPTEIPEKPDFYKDDFNIVWNRSGADKDIGIPESNVIQDINYNSYKLPVIDEPYLRNMIENLVKTRNDRFVITGIGFSLFERAWSLAGMPQVLMAMAEDSKGLHKLFDDICEFNLKIIDIALDYDIDAVYFGDDWGQQRNMIMGPDYWREFIKPRLKRMYKKVKEKNLFVIQHSCGDIHAIFDDLIEIGLDCYQTFQPEIYDIEKIKSIYSGKLSFWGAISTQQLLPKATADEVRRETIRIIKLLSKNGGYIASPTHAIEFDVPAKNILAMYDVFMNQKEYMV